MSIFNFLWSTNNKNKQHVDSIDSGTLTIAVAESITAGALSNCLCSEPGASKYFKGGIITYSKQSNKELLNVTVNNADNNFANPDTTLDMAKSIVKKFGSRIGISTTGYSLPMFRPKNDTEPELFIQNPYAYICLYDSLTEYQNMKKIDFIYSKDIPDHIQRATVQTKVALEGQKLFNNYVANQKKSKANTLTSETDANLDIEIINM